MLRVVIEFETIMFRKRKSGKPMYIQRCEEYQPNTSQTLDGNIEYMKGQIQRSHDNLKKEILEKLSLGMQKSRSYYRKLLCT